MAKRIRLTVAYDGTDYCGWQMQKNGVTVEQRLREAIMRLTGEEARVTGASRTDSGVHALGNVAVFDTDTRIPPEKLAYALNARLPEDIRIQSSVEAAPDFHPRKANCVKTYEYRIWNHRFENPIKRRYDYFVILPLNVEKMRAAAACLAGEHDFCSFAASGHQAEETIRTIYSLEVLREGYEIIFRIKGNGFLYHMVRIIAGTLIQVGAGVFPPYHVREILDARDRQAAPWSAPARGLTLMEIAYEKEPEDYLYVKEREWSYGIWQKEIRSSGEAYIYINFCTDADFERNVRRLIKKTVRDGARKVWICDRGNRLWSCIGTELFPSCFLRSCRTEDVPEILKKGLFETRFPGSGEKEGKWFYCRPDVAVGTKDLVGTGG